ncbi:ERCC4-like DNA repair endonuclease [Hamiltosporidium tvaerminnensis]|uniref:ERCC4-like DNA repair endonuclease n=1 Tax=Hamiltosporidium tvaerminnensis TaxID=1176355 RepID=A0A4Q9L3I6_9MICR|nr:ERCC4-like DNA repair endonuclease [Hamiltosporidium tvaerminnensis]
MLLEYEKEILKEANGKNYLLIMARGLGIEDIILQNIKMYLNSSSLVILLNLSLNEEKYFFSFKNKYLHNLNENPMTIDKRKALYKTGGVFYVSSRILVTDILNEVIETTKISCFLINNAETLKENSTEEFIIYLFRERNSEGLIKAFTVFPHVIMSRFSGIQQILKVLRIKKVFIYPRFHKTIKKSLAKEIELNEIKFKLPSKHEEIQMMLIEVIQCLFKELKTYCKEIDFDYENILLYGFNKILKIISKKFESKLQIKRLIADLKNMKELYYLLFNVDFKYFYQYLKAIFEEQIELKNNSTWINHPISHALLERSSEYCLEIEENSKSIEYCSEIEENNKSIEYYLEIEENNKSIKCKPNESNNKKEYEPTNSDSQTYLQISHNQKSKRIKETHFKQESKCKNNFKCKFSSNLKINKLIELIIELSSKKIVILTPNTFISECLIDKIKNFGLKINTEIKTKTENTIFNFLKPENKQETNFITVLTFYDFLLCEINYDFVFFIENDLGCIRKIETWANKTEKNVCVYLLMYKDSLEEQKYLMEIRNEKDCFVKLIENYSTMSLDLSKEIAIDLEDSEEEIREYKVYIDFREMRSGLPYFLYKSGNKIDVMSLEIGDYLLGSSICLERKNILDLISSLNSGRLYLQLKMMEHSYTFNYLLLEFDNGRRPCLSDYFNFKEESFKNSILSKLILIILHFKKIRIIWSNSHLFSIQSIRNLQKRYKNPSVEKSKINYINPILQEIILSIPGIDYFNYRKVISNFKNLKEFISSNLEKLICIFGSEKGQTIYNFFNSNLKLLFK